MLLKTKQEPISNYGLHLNDFSYFIMHMNANCSSKAFFHTLLYHSYMNIPPLYVEMQLLFFNISCMLKMEKEEPIYMCIYNGEIGGPNKSTLQEDFNVIHYLMLGKPKYQLTSKQNEIK